MSKATEIIDQLSVPALAVSLDVTERMVRKARGEGVMPSGWFDVVEAMAVSKGIECPREAFTFKTASAAEEAA